MSLVLHHGGQAVRAQQQPVAGFHVDLVQVGLQVRVAAERARDHRALRVRARLLGRQLAGLDHVGHQAVVARQLLQLPLVEQVGARVAHLGDDQPLAFQHRRRCTWCPCPRGPRPRARPAARRGSRPPRPRPARSRRDGQGARLGQHVHGDFGRHLAGGVPAHAVGHGEQRRRHHQAVLVVVAHAAHVRAAAEGAGGRAACRRRRRCPVRTRAAAIRQTSREWPRRPRSRRRCS